MPTLYWTSGPAKVSLCYGQAVSKTDANAAIGMLEDFRSQCQRLWFAFDGMINGRPLALQQWRRGKAGTHNRFSAGNQFPDQEQSIGKSTIAHIPIVELLDAMADGGEFEQLNAKAMLVFIDVMWEESTRRGIADALQIANNDVKSDLMADLHRLRNLIIHRSESAKRDYVEKATFVPQIWTINPDDVVITAFMLHAMMEQLNALHVDVGKVRCGLDGAGG